MYGGGGGGGAAHIQLLSIPQLDAIQRTLRILDVRLQHVQSNARDDERTRSDIEHIRRLMSENQNALATVITVLSSIQEEVRRLSITVHKQQTAVLQIQPPSTAGGGSATGAGSSKTAAGGREAAVKDSHRQRGSISREAHHQAPPPQTSATTSASSSSKPPPTSGPTSASGPPSTTVVLGSGVETSPL